MTATITSVTFPSRGGQCAGDLYLPAGGPAPVVIMAHGIGAERAFRLHAFAERFTDAGLAVLVFDYRNFGDSPGEPRCLVSPKRHVHDYLSAIDFVRQDERVDGRRIGLWGTSFSGGHVLVAAARDGGIDAVVSQVPFVSGIASSLIYPLRYQLPAMALALADMVRSSLGGGPVTVPVVKRGGLALLAAPDCHDGYMAMVPQDSDWPGRVPARILLTLPLYHPGRSAAAVKAPTLMVAARDDSLIPVRAVRRTAGRLPHASLRELPMGHFDPYDGERFEEVVAMETAFLVDNLKAGGEGS